MQNYKIYSIYDSKSEIYSHPYFYRSRGEFLRAFAEIANDSKSSISRYPGDFTAFEIGSWCDSNCKFELHAAPISLGVAVEYVRVNLPEGFGVIKPSADADVAPV